MFHSCSMEEEATSDPSQGPDTDRSPPWPTEPQEMQDTDKSRPPPPRAIQAESTSQ